MIKPLYEVQKRPQPKKGQPKNAVISHSEHSAERSEHYHKNIVDRMNPTQVLPATRSYPGIPN